MENNTSNVREVFIEKNKFSLISLVVVSFVFLVTFLTAFIATPSFLNRIGTTIIQWNLPLIIVGLLVVASLFETEKLARLFRLIASGLLVLTFFFTNSTKNMVQDGISNLENYLDVAIATAEKEIDNIDKYEDKVMDAAEDITRKFMRKTRDRRDYDEYDW